MRNDIMGSNFFKFAPTIVATGGTLTQTEASKGSAKGAARTLLAMVVGLRNRLL
jgi:hypothetical protein